MNAAQRETDTRRWKAESGYRATVARKVEAMGFGKPRDPMEMPPRDDDWERWVAETQEPFTNEGV